MKRQTGLVLLLSAALLGGCGGEKLDSRQLDWNDGLAYKHGDTTPFTGTAVYKDEIPKNVAWFWMMRASKVTHMQATSALTGCTEQFVKGLAEGEVRCDGLTGKQALAYGIKDEKPDGMAEIDNPRNGDRLVQLNLSAGELDGRQRIWSPDGKVMEDATYADNNVVDGQVTDGIGSIVHYKDGKLNGAAVIYTQYAKEPIAQGEYVDGVRDGDWEDSDSSANDALNQIREARPGPALPENYFNYSRTVHTLKSHWDHGSARGKVQGYDKDGQLILEWTMTDTGLDGEYMDFPEGSSQPRRLVYKDNRIVAGMPSPPAASVAATPSVAPLSVPVATRVLGALPPPRAPVQAPASNSTATSASPSNSLPAATQLAGKDAHPIPLDPNQGAIDFTSAPFPISNVDRNADNLPIYAIECNNGTCVGPTGAPIGSEEAVASQLPRLPAALLNGHGYVCHAVCWDKDHNVIGANPVK